MSEVVHFLPLTKVLTKFRQFFLMFFRFFRRYFWQESPDQLHAFFCPYWAVFWSKMRNLDPDFAKNGPENPKIGGDLRIKPQSEGQNS